MTLLSALKAGDCGLFFPWLVVLCTSVGSEFGLSVNISVSVVMHKRFSILIIHSDFSEAVYSKVQLSNIFNKAIINVLIPPIHFNSPFICVKGGNYSPMLFS